MTTLSLASVLAESARRHPHKIALVEGRQRISFTEMWRQARVQARALQRQGIRPGDHVALMCPNTAEFPRAYYAILAAGAVVVPVHLLLTADEITRVLRGSHARMLLCHGASAEVGVAAARAAGVALMSIGPAEIPHAQGRLEDHSRSDALTSFVTRRPEDPAVVFYTSGTTDRPKGAVLSHLNLVMNATVNAFDTHDNDPDDIALGALPLFHTFGQTVSMNTVWRLGSTLVLLPRFEGAAALEAMVTENVSVFHGVPTMYISLIAAAGEATSLPRLKRCVSGGAALPGAVLERFGELFGAPVYEGYGLSETSPVATTNHPAFGTRAGSIGHAVWGVDVEIARPDTARLELLPNGEPGEIVIRGHNVFTGYLDDPQATARAFTDGWFRTGDLGVKDESGFVTVTDRLKDMIIRSGHNVSPTEVEDALAHHPGVARVAVIGLPDEVSGEEVCAVVVPDAHNPVDAGELIAYGKQRLAAHKYPRRVEFTDALPLGPSLKVLKRVLRERYA